MAARTGSHLAGSVTPEPVGDSDRAGPEPSTKQWWTGSHRTRRPDATLADLLPHLPYYGITRLADLTGLDRVGVPVFAAIRPLTRSLSTAQGKGVDPVQAKISAIVEAIELWSAERIPAERQRAGRPPSITARDLATERPVDLPLTRVSLDARVATRARTRASSNGLAGGNQRSEALVHALCELVERDALARLAPTARMAGGLPRIDPSSLAEPTARQVVRRLDDADVLHAVWQLPAAIDLPVFLCHVMDRQATGDDARGWAHGSGCHPDPTVAWLRAVTEALQARLTHISGTRDDTGWERYQPLDPVRVERQRTILRQQERLQSLPANGRRRATATMAGDLEAIVEALVRAGKGPVLALDLDAGPAPLSIVKLIAPALLEPRH